MGAVDGHGSIGMAAISSHSILLPWHSVLFPLSTHLPHGIDHAAYCCFAAEVEDGGGRRDHL
jgi:hypothetical protein